MDFNQLNRYTDRQGRRPPHHTTYKGSTARTKPTKMVELWKYCGETVPHKVSCKARGATCHNCGKTNHFAKVCEATKLDTAKIHSITTNRKQQNIQTPPYSYGNPQIQLDAIFNADKPGTQQYPSTFVNVTIHKCNLVMQIDSGAYANVIPYSEFQKLQSNIQLRPTSATLKPYNSSSIPIKGVFNADITQNNQTTVQATFYVSEGTATYSIMVKYTCETHGVPRNR